MTDFQYYRVINNAVMVAKLNGFSPNEFYFMLDGIILCAQHDYAIKPEKFVEIIAYKNKAVEEYRI